MTRLSRVLGYLLNVSRCLYLYSLMCHACFFCGFLEGYLFIWDVQQFTYDMSGGGSPVYSI